MINLLDVSELTKWGYVAKITLLIIASVALFAAVIAFIILLFTRNRNATRCLVARHMEQSQPASTAAAASRTPATALNNAAAAPAQKPANNRAPARKSGSKTVLKYVPGSLPVYKFESSPVPVYDNASAATDETEQELYSAVRSEILSYARVCAFKEDSFERFVNGGNTLAMLTSQNKSVHLYLPPLTQRDLRGVPVSDGRFAQTPLFVLVDDERRLSDVKQLLRLAADQYGIQPAAK